MEIYLDNAATTKPCAAAVDAAVRCMTECYANPSSLHSAGTAALSEIDKSRRAIASALSCAGSEIIFTSCATESTNMALKSAALKYGRRKKTIITSAAEHPSVLQTMKYLSENGYNIKYISPRIDGIFYEEDFINAADDDTFMISIMLVNNENGSMLPVENVFKVIKRIRPDIICHCDAVQAFMKIPVNVKKLCCDLLSLSAHKIYAPKGIGALYIKKGIIIHPLLHGGGQENKLRSGTESVPLIAAFGAAVKFLEPDMEKNYKKYIELKNYLETKLSKTENIKVNSKENSVPYIFNFSVMGIRSEIMLHYLEKKNIFVSSGSACSKGRKSGVLEKFGADDKTADSAIRVSFSYMTEKKDIDALCNAIISANSELQKA